MCFMKSVKCFGRQINWRARSLWVIAGSWGLVSLTLSLICALWNLNEELVAEYCSLIVCSKRSKNSHELHFELEVYLQIEHYMMKQIVLTIIDWSVGSKGRTHPSFVTHHRNKNGTKHALLSRYQEATYHHLADSWWRGIPELAKESFTVLLLASPVINVGIRTLFWCFIKTMPSL